MTTDPPPAVHSTDRWVVETGREEGQPLESIYPNHDERPELLS